MSSEIKQTFQLVFRPKNNNNKGVLRISRQARDQKGTTLSFPKIPYVPSSMIIKNNKQSFDGTLDATFQREAMFV